MLLSLQVHFWLATGSDRHVLIMVNLLASRLLLVVEMGGEEVRELLLIYCGLMRSVSFFKRLQIFRLFQYGDVVFHGGHFFFL